MKVKSFQRSQELVNWWVLQLEHHPGTYVVSNNVISERLGGRPLESGEEITFSQTKSLVYPSTNFRYVIELRRAPKASIMED